LSTLSISEAFELYRQDYIVFNNQSSKTEEMNNLTMKSLVGFLGDLQVSDLTFQHVRDWKNEMSKTKSQNTVRGYIIKLRVVLSYVSKRGYKTLDPDIIGVPKRSTTPVEFVTEKDVWKLLDAAFEPAEGYSTINRYRNRAIISLLYASGIRVSELCALNRLDMREDGTFTVIGKRDRARLCFFDSRTQSYIEQYLEMRDDNLPALFISPQTGQRISKGTVQEVFKNTRKKAGFNQPIHPHTMRHSYATNLLRNNTNLYYVSKFLGHSSVQTTEMYTHYVDEDLKKIYKEKHTI
jgi:integrase/recombinase XerD